MPHPKFNSALIARAAKVRAARSLRIGTLYLRKYSQETIAEMVGCSVATVKKTLDSLERQWNANAIRKYKAAKEQELIYIEYLETVAWEAFEKSRGKITKTTVTTTKGSKSSRKIEEHESPGDPRWFAEIRALVEKRCQLLGLNAPVLVGDATPAMGREELLAKAREAMEKVRGKMVAPTTPAIENKTTAGGDGRNAVVDAEFTSDGGADGTDGDLEPDEIDDGGDENSGDGNIDTHYHNGNGQNGNGHH